MRHVIVAIVWLVSTVLLAFELSGRPRSAPPTGEREAHLTRLFDRVDNLETLADQLEKTYHNDILPIYTDLLSTGRVEVSNETALFASVFINKHSKRLGVNPLLVSAIVKIENPWLINDTTSFAGATGIMQVMPSVWREEFPECGSNLEDMNTNICTGISILHRYLERESERALDRTLLRYNGCVNTVGCESYTRKVLGDNDLSPYMK